MREEMGRKALGEQKVLYKTRWLALMDRAHTLLPSTSASSWVLALHKVGGSADTC